MTYTSLIPSSASSHLTKRLAKVALLAVFFLGALPSIASTVEVEGNRTITPKEWTEFVDRAGDGGEIHFGPGVITATGTLRVRRPVLISGSGSGPSGTRLEIEGDRRSLFFVESSDICIQDLSMGGVEEPTFDNLFDSEGRIEEGSRATTGTETAVFNDSSEYVNLQVLRCWINNVNVGIEMRRGATPDGMEVKFVDFTVTRGMILANGASVPSGKLARPFLIEDCRMVNRDGEPTYTNRPLTIRGIVFDFGNDNEGEDFDPIDMNGSVIRNCRFLRVSNWQIGMTQTSNLVIENNRLPGGGTFGRESFIHCLHFEDVGDVDKPIVIRNNRMRQRAAERLVFHIWTGGNTGSGATALQISNNSYRGISDTLILQKNRVDEAPADLQFAHTTGDDVPVEQLFRGR